jgi:two-component system response regulator YesN
LICRLVIVDDDSIIRKGLCKNIPWAEHGFKLMGTAGDGETGFQLFKATRPEIMISDIKMPFLDGLEMARRVLEADPEVRIILLTGYEEFEYAKQALQLKVFDYILKPVDMERLLQVAQRAAGEVAERQKMQWRIRESRPLLLQRFYTRLLTGSYHDETAMKSEAELLEIGPFKRWFLIGLIKLDEYYNSRLLRDETETGPEELKMRLREWWEKQLPSFDVVILDLGGDDLVMVINSEANPGELIQTTFDQCDGLRTGVAERFETTITVAIGSVQAGLDGIAVSYAKAKETIKFRHMLGKDQVLVSGALEMPVFGASLERVRFPDDLGAKVKQGLLEDALAILDRIEKYYLELPFVSLSEVRLAAVELIIELRKAVEAEENNLGEPKEGFFLETGGVLLKLTTIAEIFVCLRQLTQELVNAVNGRRKNRFDGLIDKAVCYIEAHFNREELSLAEVAREIHVSPIYLSIIFKKERQMNFVDFVTDLRLKTAMTLLRTTDLKTYEVAERVGYSNSHYFSVCFKKHVGCPPSDYKKRP